MTTGGGGGKGANGAGYGCGGGGGGGDGDGFKGDDADFENSLQASGKSLGDLPTGDAPNHLL